MKFHTSPKLTQRMKTSKRAVDAVEEAKKRFFLGEWNEYPPNKPKAITGEMMISFNTQIGILIFLWHLQPDRNKDVFILLEQELYKKEGVIYENYHSD